MASSQALLLVLLTGVMLMQEANGAVYTLAVFTGHAFMSGSDANLYVQLEGTKGSSGTLWLSAPGHDIMESGQTDRFPVTTDYGAIYRVTIGHDNSGFSPSWLFQKLVISDHRRDQMLLVMCNCWVPDTAASVSKVFPENVDECSSGPCENGGTCEDGDQAYRCTCPEGWTGLNCQTDIDECVANPCGNGGQCVNGQPGFSCTCPQGYTGHTCHTDVDECEGVSPCEHGGVCENRAPGFSCVCPDGWTGPLCQTDVDECLAAPCLHGGRCTNLAPLYACTCQPGWTGPRCETDIDECQTSGACQNGGLCSNTDGSFVCVCARGYRGGTCENDIDECSENTSICGDHGECLNHGGGYSCTCTDGYSGGHCETELLLTTEGYDDVTTDWEVTTDRELTTDRDMTTDGDVSTNMEVTTDRDVTTSQSVLTPEDVSAASPQLTPNTTPAGVRPNTTLEDTSTSNVTARNDTTSRPAHGTTGGPGVHPLVWFATIIPAVIIGAVICLRLKLRSWKQVNDPPTIEIPRSPIDKMPPVGI